MDTRSLLLVAIASENGKLDTKNATLGNVAKYNRPREVRSRVQTFGLWAAMFILACAGLSYARLRFNV